jgi:hypothetical protein
VWQCDADELRPELTLPGDQQFDAATLLQGGFEFVCYTECCNGARWHLGTEPRLTAPGERWLWIFRKKPLLVGRNMIDRSLAHCRNCIIRRQAHPDFVYREPPGEELASCACI